LEPRGGEVLHDVPDRDSKRPHPVERLVTGIRLTLLSGSPVPTGAGSASRGPPRGANLDHVSHPGLDSEEVAFAHE
jgi:hypothetical protein